MMEAKSRHTMLLSKCLPNNMKMRFIHSLSKTLFWFGLFGWVYIAANASTHPETLSLPLTHFASWPREDTFGALCFAVSMISFFVYDFTKSAK